MGVREQMLVLKARTVLFADDVMLPTGRKENKEEK